MYKKIYVPVDESDIGVKILHKAVDLAKDMQAVLRVVHVVNVQLPGFGVPMLDVPDVNNEAAFKPSRKFIGKLKAILTRDKLEGQVILLTDFGAGLVNIIARDAKEFGADLIILGTHHLGSLTHLINGGVAEGLVHITETPIMLIANH